MIHLCGPSNVNLYTQVPARRRFRAGWSGLSHISEDIWVWLEQWWN